MVRLSAIASAVLLAAEVLAAAPTTQAPDFWYVVPADVPGAAAGATVRGIVVPSLVTPTVQTTPAGSVLSWHRPDGTRQSFAIKGVPSVTFLPGPLKGTTYVPFGKAKTLQVWPDESCCSCASWENSVESIEALSCVVGCIGCGCQGCICSPTLPCPTAPPGAMTLVANADAAPVIAFGRSSEGDDLVVSGRGGAAVRFRGKRLSAEFTANGETVINNPDSIAMSGRIETSAAVRGGRAYFAWVSPDAAVILEQSRSMPSPSMRGATIEFDPGQAHRSTATAKRLANDPVLDRCRACGTHPNSDADLDLYDCVPGYSVCYRCVSWEC